jgi:hypothetical protein
MAWSRARCTIGSALGPESGGGSSFARLTGVAVAVAGGVSAIGPCRAGVTWVGEGLAVRACGEAGPDTAAAGAGVAVAPPCTAKATRAQPAAASTSAAETRTRPETRVGGV